MTIPKNTPALVKYLPFITRNFPGNLNEQEYFEACVAHGMDLHAKRREEAVKTEERCVELMHHLVCHDDPAYMRRTMFEIRTAYSESAKCRDHYERYLVGNGIEIGSGGYPMAENAIQLELSPATFDRYNSGKIPEYPVQWASDNKTHPFHDGAFDWVASSHLLEDFADWIPPLREWTRLVRRGGHLVILLPDRARWLNALRRGQPPNCAHRHEAMVGELSGYAPMLGLQAIEDRFIDRAEETNYNILFVGRKL